MNIQTFAELLSAFAAFITVSIASVELYSRGNSKMAEMAVEVYADYLFVIQQLEYAIQNMQVFVSNCENMTDKEKKAYAQNHIIDTELVANIQRIEKNSIRNNKKDKTSLIFQVAVLDFTGSATNLVAVINTFYTMVLEADSPDDSWLKTQAQRVMKQYTLVKAHLVDVGPMLKQNLKKVKDHSNLYLLSLFAVAVVFIVICFFV